MSSPFEFDLEIEGATSGFVEEHKGLNQETGQLEVERGDEIVLVHFRPVPLKKMEYAKILASSKAWSIHVSMRE